jgi:hypothetical protein
MGGRTISEDFICECGVKYRFECETIFGGTAPRSFTHPCGKGEEKVLPGRLVAWWEEHAGSWVLMGQYRQ